MIDGLTDSEKALFTAGLEDFNESDTVASGLGPRFNLDSCAGCHAAPAVGGTSPAVNPQVAVATAFGAKNVLPFFVKSDGPVREVRFKYNADGAPDGGVHALFVISGRNDGTADASGCTIKQEDFQTQAQKGNIVFRIPTPVFGGGLIESIPDWVIMNNLAATANGKAGLGIGGRPNRLRPTGAPNTSGNDGTITKFGWKAQNKSLLIFAGEAYNVEQGISNELFPQERDETPSCQFATVPNDVTNPTAATFAEGLGGPEKFANFEIHYSFKWITPGGNSGLQIRGKIDKPEMMHVGGYQADVDAGNGYTGIIYDESGVAGGRAIMSKRGEKTVWDAENKRTSTPLDKTDAEIKALIKPVGEWNDVIVVVDGNHITYKINGQLTTEMIDDSPKACKDGVIGLQMHAGHTMTLQFKDIKIKMLEKK